MSLTDVVAGKSPCSLRCMIANDRSPYCKADVAGNLIRCKPLKLACVSSSFLLAIFDATVSFLATSFPPQDADKKNQVVKRKSMACDEPCKFFSRANKSRDLNRVCIFGRASP